MIGFYLGMSGKENSKIKTKGKEMGLLLVPKSNY